MPLRDLQLWRWRRGNGRTVQQNGGKNNCPKDPSDGGMEVRDVVDDENGARLSKIEVEENLLRKNRIHDFCEIICLSRLRKALSVSSG